MASTWYRIDTFRYRTWYRIDTKIMVSTRHYRLGKTGMTFWAADFKCRDTDGGNNAEISSEDENNFVKELLCRDVADDSAGHVSPKWSNKAKNGV